MSNNIDKPKTQTKTPWQLVSMIGGAFGLIGLILLIISGIQNNKKSEMQATKLVRKKIRLLIF